MFLLKKFQFSYNVPPLKKYLKIALQYAALDRIWLYSLGDSDFCSLPSCRTTSTPGTLFHILTECVDLAPARQRVFNMWADYIRDKPFLLPIIRKYTVLCTTTEQVQFILDCSVLPDVITLWQKQGSNVHDSLFYLTRTLCFSVYKARQKLLGKWNIR